MAVVVDDASKTISVTQEITYNNTTQDTLKSIILNDWNNAYSNKETHLAKRFSDEFIRAFHLAKEHERGSTIIQSVKTEYNHLFQWKRPKNQIDIIDVTLLKPLMPNQSVKLILTYQVKVPKDRFTRYGYNENGTYTLKNWYLTPARYENGFIKYSNENLDDIANATADYEITITLPKTLRLISDLNLEGRKENEMYHEYHLKGTDRNDFNLTLESQNTFEIYSTNGTEIFSNLKDNKVSSIEKAFLIDQISNFFKENLGDYPHQNIMVTQSDYDRSPFYGLNQLPSFLSPFPDSFIYELKFLKTYSNNYLKNTLKLDPRKDNWIYDGIQMYLIMKYIKEYHPEKTMTGRLSKWWFLKGHHFAQSGFNEQFSYFYLLSARKNLDQPIGNSKETFIKYNEQIAGKYKAGLSLNYLDDYLGENYVQNSIKSFYNKNRSAQTNRYDFKKSLESNSSKNLDWFFNILIDSRELIDYKIINAEKQGDSLKVAIANKTHANVPVSLYGIKNDSVIFKTWIDNITKDSTIIIARKDADKLVLNYNNEIPEFNRRNNWRSLKKFTPNDRPFKFTFFQDLENPHYNQLFYVPSFIYNLYDGISPGLRFHNKSLLDKPFIFDLEPVYSVKTKSLIGSFSLLANTYIRDEDLYNIRYSISGSTYHYAPDAAYTKITPSIQFRMRDPNYRENKRESFLIRHVLVNREKSHFINTTAQNESYSVFNLRYSKSEIEIIRHYNFFTDAQIANSFGKLSGEIQYRRLFNNNRQINLRFFAGMFMYRSTNSDFFSFGIDRPTDYMFDYNLYGRSETSGLFSQQFINAEGAFKSKFETRFANQWITTINGSFNIWNWIEIYGDAGLFKNKFQSSEFIYDSGIRLNLVPDYFELYFPVYSSNGFEMNDTNYNEKIRFVVTISPGTLINLFTRKWF